MPARSVPARSVPRDGEAEALKALFGRVGAGGEGAAIALTMTSKVPVPVCPTASVAVQVTVVVPTGKVEPEAGRQATAATPPCSSVPAGAV